ncbi:MAG TPA: hypothetical protein VNL97_02175, partial [Solirubrobacterales bacterium]|nr:hypothetical protein [Solirubrobacterales bacterium]
MKKVRKQSIDSGAAGMPSGPAVLLRLIGCGIAIALLAQIRAGAAQADGCPNEAFRVGPSAALGECRAYELVTPPDTNGAPPRAFTFGPAGGFDTHYTAPNRIVPASPATVVFSTFGGSLPGFDGNGVSDRYLAMRGEDGWQTEIISPSGAQAEASAAGGLSADYGYSLFTVPAGSSGSLALTEKASYLRAPGGGFSLLGQGGMAGDPEALGRWISPGGEHVIFTSEHQLESDAPAAVGPGPLSAGLNFGNNKVDAVYDRTPSGVHVVSLLPGNVTPGVETTTYYRGSSADGSAVVFNVDRTMYVRRDNAMTVQIASSDAVPVGTTLSCNVGPASAASKTVQWLRNGAPIPGATSSIYTTTGADEGKGVQCQGFALNANAGSTQISNPGALVESASDGKLPGAPNFIPQPSQSEPLTVGGPGGQTLTCSTGAWTGSPTFAFQWYRNGVAIVGATSSTYMTTAADVSTAAVFQCDVTGTNSVGSVSKVSTNRATSPAPSGPPAPAASAAILGISSEPGAIVFGGISDKGGRVVYLRWSGTNSSAKLGDVFVFDADTEETTRLTSDASSFIVNVSADGSHVYFVSPSQLDGSNGTIGANNLYVWDGSSITFVAELDASDVGTNAFSLRHWINTIGAAQQTEANGGGPAQDPSESTPDGEVFVFESHANLTGYDSGGFSEVYRYDGREPIGSRLTCVSCNVGGPPAESSAKLEFDAVDSSFTGVKVPLEKLADVDNLTVDGATVYFETSDALVEGDEDGLQDVYQWRAGELSLVSYGHSGSDDWLYGVSPDGHDVFFTSSDPLVTAKEGATPAIYDARVDGGFPSPGVAGIGCEGEACQGQPAPLPPLSAPASAGFQGAGNPGPSCSRGSRRAAALRSRARRLRRLAGRTKNPAHARRLLKE